jgi:hypothetical protein
MKTRWMTNRPSIHPTRSPRTSRPMTIRNCRNASCSFRLNSKRSQSPMNYGTKKSWSCSPTRWRNRTRCSSVRIPNLSPRSRCELHRRQNRDGASRLRRRRGEADGASADAWAVLCTAVPCKAAQDIYRGHSGRDCARRCRTIHSVAAPARALSVPPVRGSGPVGPGAGRASAPARAPALLSRSGKRSRPCRKLSKSFSKSRHGLAVLGSRASSLRGAVRRKDPATRE